MGKRKQRRSLVERILDDDAAKDIVRARDKYSLDVDQPGGAALMTPLMAACQRGSLTLVKELLRHDATVHAVDDHGRSCLHHLCRADADCYRVVRMFCHLMAAGAARWLDHADDRGKTPRGRLTAIVTDARQSSAGADTKRRLTLRDAVEWLDYVEQVVDPDAPAADRARVDDREEELAWNSRMADAWGDDSAEAGFDAFAGWWDTSAEEDVPAVKPRATSAVDSMSEADYLRYINQELRRKKARGAAGNVPEEPEEVRPAEWDTEASERARRQKQAKENSERIIAEELLRTKARQRKAKAQQAKLYEARCKAFFAALQSKADLQLADVPFPEGDMGDAILGGVAEAEQGRRIRQEQKRWHPDRWMGVIRRFREADREEILRRVKETSQALNALKV